MTQSRPPRPHSRVLIVEDHALFAESLELWCKSWSTFIMVDQLLFPSYDCSRRPCT